MTKGLWMKPVQEGIARACPLQTHAFRQNCLALNDQAAALCAKAQERN